MISQQLELAFVESWARTRSFYEQDAIEILNYLEEHPKERSRFVAQFENDSFRNIRNWPSISRFFSAVVDEGYDHVLRAGTSMFLLVVSRSVEHGLRDDQPMISISFASDRVELTHNLDREWESSTHKLQFTTEINDTFTRLADRPLD